MVTPCNVVEGIGASQAGYAIGGGPAGRGNRAVGDRGGPGVRQARQVVVGHGLALLGWQRPNGRVQVEVVPIGSFPGRGGGGIGGEDGPPARRGGGGGGFWG